MKRTRQAAWTMIRPAISKISRSSYAFRLALTVLCFAALLGFVDLTQLQASLLRMTTEALLTALLMHALIIMLLAWRWQRSLRVLDRVVPFGWALGSTCFGTFLNLTLPFTIGGDVARVWLGTRAGVDRHTGIVAAIVDRAVGLISLVLLTLVITTVLGTWPLSWLAPLGLVALLTSVPFGAWLIRRTSRMETPPSALRHVVVAARRASCLLGEPAAMIALFGQSLFAHLLSIVVGYSIANGLGIALSPADALLLIPYLLLVTMLPISIGGWGVREAAAVPILAIAGVHAAGAFAIAVIFGLTQLAIGLLGTTVWLLWTKGRRGLEQR